MFEFHAYDWRAHVESPTQPTPALASATSASKIAALSFLSWSEHCVECAAPACYDTCALYRPRADGRCRRFAYGIFRDTRFAGLRGFGADIAFRRWGKLKANGNTRMEPVATVLRQERWLERTITLRYGLGRLANMFGRTTVWSDRTRYLDRRARRRHRGWAEGSPTVGLRPAPAPDAFLIEIYNPGDAPVAMELEMRVAADLIDDADAAGAPAPFRRVVKLVPGHSRQVIPHAAFAAVSDCGLPFKLAFTPIGEATPRLVILALDFVRWRTPAEETTCSANPLDPPAIKCVVFDLDETLWRGTLSEGGAEDLRPAARSVLAELDRRGILLAVASRNDAAPALARLTRFELADLFVATRISWGAKSAAVAGIASQLNLGLDAFAFVDDSAFERAEVAAALPQVACFDAKDLGALVAHSRMRGGAAPVALDRRRLYREAARRDARRATFADDEEAFLRSCQLRLNITPCGPADIARVIELAQRTNQLNASGTRYGPDAGATLINRSGQATFVLRCADLYGDYGLVGFAAVRFPADVGVDGGVIRVEEFMLSCRVQGRRLERAFFHYLATATSGAPAKALWINFRATGRNGPAARVLADLGFRPCAHGGRTLDLPAPDLASDLVAVVAPDDDRLDASARRMMA